MLPMAAVPQMCPCTHCRSPPSRSTSLMIASPRPSPAPFLLCLSRNISLYISNSIQSMASALGMLHFLKHVSAGVPEGSLLGCSFGSCWAAYTDVRQGWDQHRAFCGLLHIVHPLRPMLPKTCHLCPMKTQWLWILLWILANLKSHAVAHINTVPSSL